MLRNKSRGKRNVAGDQGTFMLLMLSALCLATTAENRVGRYVCGGFFLGQGQCPEIIYRHQCHLDKFEESQALPMIGLHIYLYVEGLNKVMTSSMALSKLNGKSWLYKFAHKEKSRIVFEHLR